MKHDGVIDISQHYDTGLVYPDGDPGLDPGLDPKGVPTTTPLPQASMNSLHNAKETHRRSRKSVKIVSQALT